MNTESKIIFSNQILKELELAKSFMLELDEDGLVILSAVNVAKAEAMIKTDSSYTKSSNIDYNKSSAFLFSKLNSEMQKSVSLHKLKQTSKKTKIFLI